MSHRRVILAMAAVLSLATAAPSALAGSAPSSEQTHPQVKPKVGGKHRTFHLSFTLAQAPGQSGTEYTEYRVVVSAPAHTAASCTPTQPAPVVTGSQGQVEKIPLHPPKDGWCKGRYHVIVYLDRTPTCGPPVVLQPHIICPVAADATEPGQPAEQTNTGETHFTVH